MPASGTIAKSTATRLHELELWLDQYGRQVATLDAQAVAAVIAAYAAVDDWADPNQTLPAAVAAAATSQAALRVQTGLMTEYLRFATRLFVNFRQLHLPRDLGEVYPRKAEPFQVYSRPVFAAREQLRLDDDLDRAREVAERRIKELTLTDSALMRRVAARAVLEEIPQVTGYRRVIRPELSETGTCGLCIAAALQRYKVEELLPLHTLCKCTVLPILGDEDPARQFNEDDLDAAYAEAPGTVRGDLVKTRFIVEDTELGPTLVQTNLPETKQRGSAAAPADGDDSNS